MDREKKGIIACDGNPDLQVAALPEFKEHEGIWSPEDLFVASVNVYVMSTFLALAEWAGVAFASYQSEAVGRLAGCGKSPPAF